MSEDFGDLSMAARMREVIAGIVRDELDKARVLPRYGKVQSVDRPTKTAMVLFDGDTFPVKVRVPDYLQTASDTLDYANKPIVKVEGSGTNTWVTEILYGSNYQARPRLFQPVTLGGTTGETPMVTRFGGRTPGQPAVGNCWVLGTWSNNGATAFDNKLYFELTVRRVAASAHVAKKYAMGLNLSNYAATGWFKLVPIVSDNADNTEFFDVEVQSVNGTDIQFLVRRKAGGFANAWYDFDLEIFGEGFEQTAGPDAAESTQGEPHYTTEAVLNPYYANGPLGPAEQAIGYKGQQCMSGGGIRDWDGTSVSWTTRFIVMGLGKASIISAGYWDIAPPTNGSNLSVYNKSGAVTVTCTANSVPMGAWDTLYWEPVLYTSNAGSDGQLHIVNYNGTGTSLLVPAHWIKLAQINGDTNECIWFDGEKQTPWTALPYGANVAEYSSVFAARYRKHNGRVELRGLIKATAALASGATLFTLPAGFRPNTSLLFIAAMYQAGNGSGRLDIAATGVVSVPYTRAINTEWVSLDGITFTPMQ